VIEPLVQQHQTELLAGIESA